MKAEVRKPTSHGRFKTRPPGAGDTVPPYVDNRPMLVAGKPELREYKAVFVVGDEDLSRRSRTKAEVSQFSDEIPVNCVPLV